MALGGWGCCNRLRLSSTFWANTDGTFVSFSPPVNLDVLDQPLRPCMLALLRSQIQEDSCQDAVPELAGFASAGCVLVVLVPPAFGAERFE